MSITSRELPSVKVAELRSCAKIRTLLMHVYVATMKGCIVLIHLVFPLALW